MINKKPKYLIFLVLCKEDDKYKIEKRRNKESVFLTKKKEAQIAEEERIKEEEEVKEEERAGKKKS